MGYCCPDSHFSWSVGVEELTTSSPSLHNFTRTGFPAETVRGVEEGLCLKASVRQEEGDVSNRFVTQQL